MGSWRRKRLRPDCGLGGSCRSAAGWPERRLVLAGCRPLGLGDAICLVKLAPNLVLLSVGQVHVVLVPGSLDFCQAAPAGRQLVHELLVLAARPSRLGVT